MGGRRDFRHFLLNGLEDFPRSSSLEKDPLTSNTVTFDGACSCKHHSKTHVTGFHRRCRSDRVMELPRLFQSKVSVVFLLIVVYILNYGLAKMVRYGLSAAQAPVEEAGAPTENQ